MKIIIFGATGGTGLQLVVQALKQSHEVTAFTRNPEKLKQIDGKINIIKGDVLDISSVENAVEGHSAVFCLLGMPNVLDKSGLRAKGTINIINSMENMGVERLICQSALGTGNSEKLLPFHYRYFIVPLFMKQLYQDHANQENYIKKSSLAWTIIRPGALTDGEKTGIYQHALTDSSESIKAKISRADTANFMLRQLNDDTYHYQMPYVSY